jgi:proteasome accessory factor C
MAHAPEHIPRLLALVRALVSARRLPIARLCDELGVSEEELRADIELLSLCGLPPYGPDNLIDIQVGKDGVVRMSNRVLAPPPLQLSDEEAAGLRLALKLAEAQGWPETRALGSAIRKLEAALLPERREGARRLARRVGVATAASESREARFLPLVRKAIESGNSVDLVYYSDGREARTERRVDPYRLVATEWARYLIAWCHVRKAVLTFRLDRILRARKTSAKFTPPEGIRAEDYLGESPKDAKTMTAVTVRFAPAVATVALESYPDAKATKDGGAEWKTRVWPTLAFCRQIVAWGGAAEVIEPQEVRDRVRAYARDLVRRYDGSGR